jgi:hypothetical protein
MMDDFDDPSSSYGEDGNEDDANSESYSVKLIQLEQV